MPLVRSAAIQERRALRRRERVENADAGLGHLADKLGQRDSAKGVEIDQLVVQPLLKDSAQGSSGVRVADRPPHYARPIYAELEPPARNAQRRSGNGF